MLRYVSEKIPLKKYIGKRLFYQLYNFHKNFFNVEDDLWSIIINHFFITSSCFGYFSDERLHHERVCICAWVCAVCVCICVGVCASFEIKSFDDRKFCGELMALSVGGDVFDRECSGLSLNKLLNLMEISSTELVLRVVKVPLWE